MNKATINILLAWLAAILLLVLFVVFGDYVRSLYAGATPEIGAPMRAPSGTVLIQRVLVWSVAGSVYMFGTLQGVFGLLRANRTQKLWALPPLLFYLLIGFLLIRDIVT